MYAGGNPVNRIDPTGEEWKDFYEGMTEKWEELYSDIESTAGFIKDSLNDPVTAVKAAGYAAKETLYIPNLVEKADELITSAGEGLGEGAGKIKIAVEQGVSKKTVHKIIGGVAGS